MSDKTAKTAKAFHVSPLAEDTQYIEQDAAERGIRPHVVLKEVIHLGIKVYQSSRQVETDLSSQQDSPSSSTEQMESQTSAMQQGWDDRTLQLQHTLDALQTEIQQVSRHLQSEMDTLYERTLFIQAQVEGVQRCLNYVTIATAEAGKVEKMESLISDLNQELIKMEPEIKPELQARYAKRIEQNNGDLH